MQYYTYSGRSGTKMMFNFMDMTFYTVAVLPPPYMLEWPRNKARVLYVKTGNCFQVLLCHIQVIRRFLP